MPKRTRARQSSSPELLNNVVYYDDKSTTPPAAPSSPPVDPRWYDEPKPAATPPTKQPLLGKRRKMAPRVITFDSNRTVTTPPPDNNLSPPPPAVQPDKAVDDVADGMFPGLNEWEDVEEPGVPLDSAVTQTVGIHPEKNPNYYLRLWLQNSCDAYVHMSYERDQPPLDSNCASCGSQTDRLYRCSTCLGGRHVCKSCLIQSHAFLPTHRAQLWTKNLWQSVSMADLGLVVYLGHGGKPCDAAGKLSQLHVGDMHGFVPVQVQYCQHELEGSVTKALQLLRVGLFPCSDIKPKSAFTTTLLDTYNIFTTLGRTSAHKFYHVLARITKPGFPTDVKDRYRELIYTHRRYLKVLKLRRAGHLFEKHCTEVILDDEALDCIACPRPGLNFEWTEVLPSEMQWFRAIMGWDGNFCSDRKDKKVDEGDLALSDGNAYSPPKEAYKEWALSQKGPQRKEKPSCDHHKAGNDISVRFSGRDVTGVGAFTCASHSCYIPRGMVDFFQGERFIHADYALASCLKYITQGGRLSVGMTYDVMCHWERNFKERAKNLPPELTIPSDLDFWGAIGKWHLPGHIPECYIRYSLDHTQFVGRIDGEGVERVWAHQNEHSGSTSEQGPGMRTDSMNNVAQQWNFEIMCRLKTTLPERYKKARSAYLMQKPVFEDLSARFSPDEIAALESASIEPVKGTDGKWTSPLMDPIFINGKLTSTVQIEQEKETVTARAARRQLGVTQWLSTGIELEHNMKKINDKSKDLGKEPSRRQTNELNTSRLALRDQIVAHEKSRLAYMAGIDAPDHPQFSPIIDESMEGAIVILPSSYQLESMKSAGLSSLVELEAQLRRAVCHDTLESVRQLLGSRAFTLKNRTQQPRGQVTTTRSRARMKRQTEELQRARWRYTNSRDALLRLVGSLNREDAHQYCELTDKDLQTLKSYIEETSRGVGQGHAVISWIWRTSDITDPDEWEMSVLRTEWFRSRERYKRWEEQLVLVKREMVMAIRHFMRSRDMWRWKASQSSATPGMKSYALAKSEWFKDLATSMYTSCNKSLADDTVSLEWASTWLKNNVNGLGISVLVWLLYKLKIPLSEAFRDGHFLVDEGVKRWEGSMESATLRALTATSFISTIISATSPLLTALVAYRIAYLWILEECNASSNEKAEVGPTPLQYGLLLQVLNASTIVSIVDAVRYATSGKSRASAPPFFIIAVILVSLVFVLTHLVGLADIWMHATTSAVLYNVTHSNDLQSVKASFMFNDTLCGPDAAPNGDSIFICLAIEDGWGYEDGTQFLTSIGQSVISNSSSDRQIITLADEGDLAIAVPSKIDQLATFKATTFGALAKCESLNVLCPLSSAQQPNCSSLSINIIPTETTVLRSYAFSDPTKWNTTLPNPDRGYDVIYGPSICCGTNPVDLVVQLRWTSQRDGDFEQPNPALYTLSIPFIDIYARCSVMFYNMTVAYDGRLPNDRQWSVVPEGMTPSSNIFASTLAGPLTWQLLMDSLALNIRSTAMSSGSADEVMAALSQELGRLSLGYVSGAFVPAPATEVTIFHPMILGRYPIAPTLTFVGLLLVYGFIALAIFAISVNLTSEVISVPSALQSRSGSKRGIATLELAQLRLLGPLPLVAQMFEPPIHDPSNLGPDMLTDERSSAAPVTRLRLGLEDTDIRPRYGVWRRG